MPSDLSIGLLIKTQADTAQIVAFTKEVAALGQAITVSAEKLRSLGASLVAGFDTSRIQRLTRDLSGLAQGQIGVATSAARAGAEVNRAGAEANRALGEVTVRAARAARGEIDDLARETGKLPPRLNETARAASGIGTAFRGAGALAATYFSSVAITRGIESLIGGGVRYNALLEQQQIAFGTLLSSASAAEARMKSLAVFAAVTPYELPEIVQASKLLQAFTGDALAAGDGLRLVGDAAAAVGAPIEATALWMGRLFSALRSGQPVGEALQNLTQLGLVSGEVRDRITALQGRALGLNEAMEVMSQNFGRYAGAMAAQSKTFNGQLSALTDNLRTLTGELTKPLFDRLGAGMAEANARMDETREMIVGTTEAIKDLTKWAAIAAAGIAGIGAGTIAVQGGGLLLGGLLAAKFTAAVAAAPVWASIGGVVAAGILAGVGIYRASAGAIGALNDQSRAEGGEDARLASVRQRLFDSRTPEDVESAGRIASRLAAGYRLSAQTATNDGGLFGVDGEKDRLESLAQAYERLATLAEKRSAAILAASTAEAAAKETAAAATRFEEAKVASLEAGAKLAKETSDALAALAAGLAQRLQLAEFATATEGRKLELLTAQEETARRQYGDDLLAASFARNDAAANAAELRLALELLEIDGRRAAIVKARADAKEREMIAARKEAAEAEAREKRAEIAQIEQNRFLTEAERKAKLYAVYLREAADLPNRIAQTRSALEVEQRARPGGAGAAQLTGELSGLQERQAVGLPADIARTRPLGLGEDIAAQLTALRDGFASVATSIRDVTGGAINGIAEGIGGLIRGTMTWGAALAHIGGSILNGIINAISRMAAEWLAGMVIRATVGKALAATALAASIPLAAAASSIWAAPAVLASTATLGGAAAQAPASIAASIAATRVASLAGFSAGGFTGPGEKHEVAGLVHRGEVVFSQADVARLGGVAVVENLRVNGSGGLSGVEMVEALRVPGGAGPLPPSFVGGSSPSVASAGGGSGPTPPPVINLGVFDSRKSAETWAESQEGQSYIVDVVARNLHRIGNA